MIPLDLLSPYKWLIYGGFALAVCIGVPILWERHNATEQAIGYDKRAAEDKTAAEAQTARNRELQRAAETRYVVQAQARDRFIVQTVTEVRHVTDPLASCPVPADAVRLLNDAARCASADSAAACGADKPLPAASATR